MFLTPGSPAAAAAAMVLGLGLHQEMGKRREKKWRVFSLNEAVKPTEVVVRARAIREPAAGSMAMPCRLKSSYNQLMYNRLAIRPRSERGVEKL